MPDEDKKHELIEDVLAPRDFVSNCCSGRVYSPSGEWAQCLTCFEYCEAVMEE